METIQKEVKRRGRPKKVVDTPKQEAVINEVKEETQEVKESEVQGVRSDVQPDERGQKVVGDDEKSKKQLTDIERKILESRKLLDVPLEHGMKLFESPDGEIILGEASKGHVWSRTMNNGRGGWANARR